MRSKRIGPTRFAHLPRLRYAGLEVPVAADSRSRLLGLAWLDRDQAPPGLLIPRCRSIHTFGMRFPLGLVFLDRQLRPIQRLELVPPGRLRFCRAADAVLEIVASEVGP